MNFQIISEKQYRDFWEKSDQKCFLSSPEFGNIRKNNNWNVEFVGINKNKKIIAASMLLSKKRRFNKKEYCALRGPLMDYSNKQLVNFFIQELKSYVKKNGGYILTIDPYVIFKQRDIDGNIVESGIDNTKIYNSLIRLGFKKRKKSEQVSWMFSLDVEGKDEQTILKEMKPNTRNIIKKTDKIGITTRKLKYDELEQFYNILIETGARKNFIIRDLSYYQNVYKQLNDRKEVLFLITELNLKHHIKLLKDDLQQKENELKSIKKTKHNEGKIKNIKEDIKTLTNKINEAKKIIKEEGKETIVLSGSMFVMIKPEVIYLSSGNYEKYMNYNSQYLIQWEMIKYAINNGFKKYNFYGIPANINTHPKEYGIYKFKKGFNGYVEELLGQYELPISKEYYLNKIINLKNKLF